MVALPKDRELSARWQRAAELLLAEADVADSASRSSSRYYAAYYNRLRLINRLRADHPCRCWRGADSRKIDWPLLQSHTGEVQQTSCQRSHKLVEAFERAGRKRNHRAGSRGYDYSWHSEYVGTYEVSHPKFETFSKWCIANGYTTKPLTEKAKKLPLP